MTTDKRIKCEFNITMSEKVSDETDIKEKQCQKMLE